MSNTKNIERDTYWDQRIVEFVDGIVPEEQRVEFYKWVKEYDLTHATPFNKCPLPLITDTDYAGYYISNIIADEVENTGISSQNIYNSFIPARERVVKELYIKFIDYGEVVNNDNPGITPTF